MEIVRFYILCTTALYFVNLIKRMWQLGRMDDNPEGMKFIEGLKRRYEPKDVAQYDLIVDFALFTILFFIGFRLMFLRYLGASF